MRHFITFSFFSRENLWLEIDLDLRPSSTDKEVKLTLARLSELKGKKHNKKNKCIWKTAQFDASCIKIGFLVLKIPWFYVFEMEAAILNKREKYKTQFISQKYSYHSHLTNVTFVYYANNHFMEVFYEYCTLFRQYCEKYQYPLWVSDVITSLNCWFPAWHF